MLHLLSLVAHGDFPMHGPYCPYSISLGAAEFPGIVSGKGLKKERTVILLNHN